VANGDDHVTVAVLQNEFEHQRKFFESQVAHLGERLEAHCKIEDERHRDHEARLRVVEQKTTWSRVIEGLLGVVTVVAGLLGWKQP